MKMPEQWAEELVKVREIPHPASLAEGQHYPYRLNVAGQDLNDYRGREAADRRAEVMKIILTDAIRLAVRDALRDHLAGCPMPIGLVVDMRSAVLTALASGNMEFIKEDLPKLVQWQQSVIRFFVNNAEGEDLRKLLADAYAAGVREGCNNRDGNAAAGRV